MILALAAFACASESAPSTATIDRVASMVWDPAVRSMAARVGLDVVNVTWEDTGRSKGSSVGPNISDMTIGVRDGSGALHPMPVFRFDNFSDVTADLASEDLWLRVGNETGDALRPVSLAELLRNTRSHLSDPSSWAGGGRSLWAARDTEVLVSAQACFLPVPRSGQATFTPVLYNYQSYPGNPAVLTMVATREGTSIQVVENEGGYLSEVLSFNDDGERAPFTATRLSEAVGVGGLGFGASEADAREKGLDMVLVVQVPLKQRPVARVYEADGFGMPAPSAGASAKMASAARGSDVEAAVLGHGPTEGPYAEIGGLAIERDTRFPVRVTVQFYKATSNGVVTEADVRGIRQQIDAVYADARSIGSLVTEGMTGRSTEWVRTSPRVPVERAQWADPFWSWHTAQ